MYSQVYVDDPALTVVGPPRRGQRVLDCTLVWWLLLGMPLSWTKGHVHEELGKHVWIGVEYSLREDGVAIMELPAAYFGKPGQAVATAGNR